MRTTITTTDLFKVLNPGQLAPETYNLYLSHGITIIINIAPILSSHFPPFIMIHSSVPF